MCSTANLQPESNGRSRKRQREVAAHESPQQPISAPAQSHKNQQWKARPKLSQLSTASNTPGLWPPHEASEPNQRRPSQSPAAYPSAPVVGKASIGSYCRPPPKAAGQPAFIRVGEVEPCVTRKALQPQARAASPAQTGSLRFVPVCQPVIMTPIGAFQPHVGSNAALPRAVASQSGLTLPAQALSFETAASPAVSSKPAAEPNVRSKNAAAAQASPADAAKQHAAVHAAPAMPDATSSAAKGPILADAREVTPLAAAAAAPARAAQAVPSAAADVAPLLSIATWSASKAGSLASAAVRGDAPAQSRMPSEQLVPPQSAAKNMQASQWSSAAAPVANTETDPAMPAACQQSLLAGRDATPKPVASAYPASQSSLLGEGTVLAAMGQATSEGSTSVLRSGLLQSSVKTQGAHARASSPAQPMLLPTSRRKRKGQKAAKADEPIGSNSSWKELLGLSSAAEAATSGQGMGSWLVVC